MIGRLTIAIAAVLLTAAAARAEGEAAAGAKVFLTCALCHSFDPEVRKTGPHLRGIVGRRIGGDPDFDYSKALERARGGWTEERLDEFLANPRKMFPATRMVARVADEQDRADLIAFLRSAGSNP